MERMTIRPLSIPRIRFAHEYGSDDYDITFPIISDQLEISYLVDGDVLWESGEERLRIPEGSVVVNDFARVFRQYGDGHACRTAPSGSGWRMSGRGKEQSHCRAFVRRGSSPHNPTG